MPISCFLCEERSDMNITIGTRIEHPSFGEGIIAEVGLTSYTGFFRTYGDKEIALDFEGVTIIEAKESNDAKLSLEDVQTALSLVLKKYSDIQEVVSLAEKWKGGKIIFQPFDPDASVKEVPIQTFFHKIVMVRDRLRVLEQNINSHKTLDDQDKVHLQQYITRAYGSLTTFNVFFKDKSQHFKGGSKG